MITDRQFERLSHRLDIKVIQLKAQIKLLRDVVAEIGQEVEYLTESKESVPDLDEDE